MPELRLRSAAWYGDRLIRLALPADWSVNVVWPRTPPPLTDDQISAALAAPIGQAPIKDLCRGKRRPVVIVDDLNRPTPAYRVLPAVFEQFRAAGIEPRQVRILVATGTHIPPSTEAAARKIGPELARACEVITHDALRGLKRVGRTAFGTPIDINWALADSDFVVGIGGIYPNHTAGFGGGSKLALGVLGLRSIMHLHYGHLPVGWSNDPSSTLLRQELDEIASAIGLRTTICLHIDAEREVVRAVSGDHSMFYADEVSFVRRTYSAPEPASADVVISNAYPNDLSLTFSSMKGFVPLARCAPQASRIGITPCTEGLGRHELMSASSVTEKLSHIVRRVSIMTPGEFAAKCGARIRRRLAARPAKQAAKRSIWVYRPHEGAETLSCSGMRVGHSWPEIIDAVVTEQGHKRALNVVVYPCAPLMCLEPIEEYVSSHSAAV
ncbi:MAG TPA: lactate racemase domain-containing protein [Bryobacteraceae bacterium]|nr:lactate racemase domain-containing protein [Bryobacteraceae bacterium]